jgi:hypothetical protein
MPFIPAIGSAIGGIFGGKKATAAAQKRSPEEATALAGGQAAGTALAGQGAGLYGTGTGMVRQGETTLAQPTSYYQRLLSGNRALASQAVAAPRAAISDVYRGAERNLEQGGVRGAARDVAKGEIARSRASQISGLITGVQPGAASALTGIGQGQVGAGAGIASTGVGATGASGSLFANLLPQGMANRQYARGEGEKFGTGFGGLIFDILSGVKGVKKKGGIPSAPSYVGMGYD